MKIKLVLIIFLCYTELWSQKVTIYNGLNTNLTDQKIKMIDSKEDFSNEGGFCEIEYEHLIGKKFSIGASYFRYEGTTNVKFRPGSVVNGDNTIDLFGFSGIYFERYNLFTRYKIGNKLALEPGIGLSYQKSHNKGYEVGFLDVINGPDYVATGGQSFSYDKVQIVPIADVRLSYTFFELISLNLRVAGAYGFQSHQDLYLDYMYKGVQQPTALFQARGTGVFYTAGVSLNLATLFSKVKKLI